MGADEMKIEGDPPLPYTLREQNFEGSTGSVIGRFATIQEARDASRRLDKRYVLLKAGKHLPSDWRTKDY